MESDGLAGVRAERQAREHPDRVCEKGAVGQESQEGRHEALSPWLLWGQGPEGTPHRTWAWEAE